MTTRQAEWVEAWCCSCGTKHEKGKECPGGLLATGPERHGWRVLADTPRGPEVYGALVAPAHDCWRARILTFPNVLWVIPHGGTMKFMAGAPAVAERRAVDFIKEQCNRMGYTIRTEVPSVESADVDLEQDETTAKSDAVRASQRRLCTESIRYGVGRPSQEAATDDLSEGGLFIRTDSPMPVGTQLQLYLDVENFGIPLRGVIRWIREQEEDGRPCGMGLQLTNPLPRYIHYIRQRQHKKQPQAETSATHELEEWKSPHDLEEWEDADSSK